MRTYLFLILKFSISITLLFFIYRKTPIEQIQELLTHVDVRYLPFIFFLLAVNTVISAKKWQLFLRADSLPLSLTDLTLSYMSGTFCNLFLPSSIGGDSYRVYDIAQKSKEGVRSAASVFADRFSGFIALVTLSLISSVYVAFVYKELHFLVVPLLLAVFFFIIIAFLVKQTLFRTMLRVTRLNRIGLVTRFSEKLFLSFRSYGASKGLMVQVMIVSFVFQFSVITVVYLIACSIGAAVPFLYFSAFVPLITLMEAVPISIYGIGLRDYGYVFFFSQVGMSNIETRSLALLFMAITICYSLFGGLVFLYKIWLRPRKA